MEILQNCRSSLCFVNVIDDNVLPCPTAALFGFAGIHGVRRMQVAPFVMILKFSESRLFAGAAFSCTWLSVSVCRMWERRSSKATLYWSFDHLRRAWLCFTGHSSASYDFFHGFLKVKFGSRSGCDFLSVVESLKNEKMWSKAQFAIFHDFWSPQCDWQSCAKLTTLKAEISILNSRNFRNRTLHEKRRHIVET